MLAYPTGTDVTEALPVLLSFIEGQSTAPHAAHAAYIVIGYGLSLGIPDTPLKLALAVDHKATLQVAVGQANSGMLGAINWQQLLQIALSILTQILAGG